MYCNSPQTFVAHHPSHRLTSLQMAAVQICMSALIQRQHTAPFCPCTTLPGSNRQVCLCIASLHVARGPTGPGIMPGSGSNLSIIFEAGIQIPAVFGAVGIKLVVSQQIQAELCMQCWASAQPQISPHVLYMSSITNLNSPPQNHVPLIHMSTCPHSYFSLQARILRSYFMNSFGSYFEYCI